MKQDEGDIFGYGKEPEIPEEKFSVAKLIAKIIDFIKKHF